LVKLRHACRRALTLAGLAASIAFAPLHPVGNALAQDSTAALVARPVSLPDIAIGSAKAPITIN
jgi:hypothetical protein